MTSEKTRDQTKNDATRDMLRGSGYADKAIDYFVDQAYMGSLDGANLVTEMTGSCGDTMKIFLKIEAGKIADARYQVLGCPGAVASAMAAVEAIKNKPLEEARQLNDNDIFKMLEEIPVKKHHCIQLAVKTLHKALDEHQKIA